MRPSTELGFDFESAGAGLARPAADQLCCSVFELCCHEAWRRSKRRRRKGRAERAAAHPEGGEPAEQAHPPRKARRADALKLATHLRTARLHLRMRRGFSVPSPDAAR